MKFTITKEFWHKSIFIAVALILHGIGGSLGEQNPGIWAEFTLSLSLAGILLAWIISLFMPDSKFLQLSVVSFISFIISLGAVIGMENTKWNDFCYITGIVLASFLVAFQPNKKE